MAITNKTGLSAAWVIAAEAEHIHHPADTFSVTELLKGARETLLLRRHGAEIESDVSDMVWLIFGRAVHEIMSQHAPPGSLVEARFTSHVPNTSLCLTGQPDLYVPETGIVTDYKTTSVWKIIGKEFDDWIKQVHMYCWLLEKSGEHPRGGRIEAFMKDHSKSKARQDADYPQLPSFILNVPWDDKARDQIAEFISLKLADIENNLDNKDNNLYICSAEERYRKPDKWAVMRRDRQKAVKLHMTEAEAIADCASRGSGHFIEARPGTDEKCLGYCSAREFCSYYHGMVKKGA